MFPSLSYRGTSLVRKRTPLGPYRRPMPRVLGWSSGGGRAPRPKHARETGATTKDQLLVEKQVQAALIQKKRIKLRLFLLARSRAPTTLETTLGQIAPPKSGHPLECYLNQVAFPESLLNICPHLDSRAGYVQSALPGCRICRCRVA